MTPLTAFAGRKVALFGLGGSGIATARALAAGGADVVVWDDTARARARAGNEGKGFAVVAGEVKNLANSTRSSLGDIGELVERMQDSVAVAAGSVGAVQATTESLTATAETLAQMADSLQLDAGR